MDVQSSGSIVCPTLIGRGWDLTILQRHIDRARQGQGRGVLISGEAGIGKSRLVAEAKVYAGSLGFVLLCGNCFQPDIACPYAPLLDLFRTYFSQSNTATGIAVEPFAHVFSQLLPELVPAPPNQLPQLEPEQEKRRLFSTLCTFITQRAAQQPVLVIIEDMHWSDDTSLEFLGYLARRCVNQRLLLLMTYRTDEVRPSLKHFLAQLDHERLADELSLSRLSLADVHAMLQAIFELQRSVRSDFLTAIYELTDGNPFFVEEVLKSLVAAGDIFYEDGVWDRKALSELHIPRSVQDAVQQRFIQLSATAGQTVRLAAVAGRRFDFTLLQTLVQCDEQQFLTGMKELVAAQLVVEESAERFAFRHALTRQAIYSDLLGRERKALHQAIAETIEQLYRETLDTHIADLAFHYYQADAWEQALNYSRQAGERALAVYAPRAAHEHFSHALYAAERLQYQSPTALYRARGQANELLGDFEAARHDYARALETAQAAAHDREAWESLIALGCLWAGRDYKQTGAFFERALDLAQRLGDPELHAHSLNRRGNWLVNVGRADEALQAHHAALELFQAMNHKHGMAETRDLLGMATLLYDNLVSAANHYRQAIALFRTLENLKGLTSSLASSGTLDSSNWAETTISPLGTAADGEPAIEEALRIARKIGSLADEAYAEIQLGLMWRTLGEFGQALAHGQRALHIATEIEHPQWTAGAHCSLGRVYISMLAPDLAIRHLEVGLPLAQKLGSAWWVGNISAYLALAYLLRNEAPRAETVLGAALQTAEPPRNSSERRMAWAWGQLTLQQGRAEEALRVADQLLVSAPGDMTQAIPVLLKLRGEALMALHRFAEAQQALESAERGAIERHERPLLWQIHVSLGRLHRALKHEEQGSLEYTAARTIIEALAETIDDRALHEQFLNAALLTMPQPRPRSARRVEAEKFGGLSVRERQVVAQIAQGKSNHEIADALFLSERTVETHVSNVLSKLGFTSRAQVAAWAVGHGLATSVD